MPLDQNIPVCYTAIDIKRTEKGPDIKFFKKVGSAINFRAFAYTSFVLSVCAAVFLSSATWTYGWIADLYPLGDKFVPTLLGIICACSAVNLGYLLICAFAGDKGLSDPELNKWSLRHLREEIEKHHATLGVSNSRTCEIGLCFHGGISYINVAALVNRCATRKSSTHP